jgi:hypothetical protein
VRSPLNNGCRARRTDAAQQPDPAVRDRNHERGQERAKSIRGKRLEQVIDRACVECLNRIALEGRDEDGDGHLFHSDGFHHLKAVHLWHLDIEKDQIGLHLPDGVNGRLAIAALADHGDVALALEQPRQCCAS